MSVYAKVIADSVAPDGTRVTSMEARMHRYMLPEFNTHGVFSRNSASSRAIPVTKVLARLRENPALPLTWRREQKGMQGGDHLDPVEVAEAMKKWNQVLDLAVTTAEDLHALGVHKSTTNRLLEPFSWHTIVVTSTSFENFFDQRVSDQAQDEIRAVAEAMRQAYQASTPVDLAEGEWHLPYVDETTRTQILDRAEGDQETFARLAPRISAARCARTSYLTQAGIRDLDADLGLYQRLVTARPAHWSPLEHPATPWEANRQTNALWFEDGEHLVRVPTNHLPRVGKLVGWRPLRTQVEAQQGAITWR